MPNRSEGTSKLTRHTALLEGPAGTGKTTSLRTAFPHVERAFILSTEPGLEIVLRKKLGDLPIPGSNVHWKYLPPARPSWSNLRDAALKINSLDIEALQKQKMGINKTDYDQFLQMIDVLGNFECDCCKKSHGAADEWGENDLLAMDGLTGISTMSMDLTVGAKPVKTQPDWGVAMDNLERFVGKCVFDTRCSFILLAHVAKEKDEVSGAIHVTTSTLGNKLAPKLVQMFDEVLLAKKGEHFHWSNNEPMVDLKNRYLPLSSELDPDWGQLLKE